MDKAEIQKLQDLYNQWVKLQPELEKSLELWQRAEQLLKPLDQFYGSQTWRKLHDTFDEPLDTQGNYSILSEDALWNAFSDHRELYETMQAVLKESVSNR